MVLTNKTRTKRAQKRARKEQRAYERSLGHGGLGRRKERQIRRAANQAADRQQIATAASERQPCEEDDREPAPASTRTWVASSAEPFNGKLVWGAVCGRYWLGEPGASELLARAGLMFERIRASELEDEEARARENIRQLLAQDHYQRTGLRTMDADRIEWLVSWHPDGHLVERCRVFEAGDIKPAQRIAPSQMTLADIKAKARAWGVTVDRTIGAPSDKLTPELIAKVTEGNVAIPEPAVPDAAPQQPRDEGPADAPVRK